MFFYFFQSLCSFVVPLALISAYFALALISTTLQRKHETVCKVLREVLFSIYYLYPLLPHLSPFPSAGQSLSCLCLFSLHLSSLSSSSTLFLFFHVHLCPLLTCPPLSSPLFREFIGALYLASHLHLNWLAVNFRPTIAKWLISLSCSRYLCHSLSPKNTGQAEIHLILIH